MLQPESFTETAYDLSNPAGGDLLTARTRDEVGELIRSFNSKVAQLKARMVMKQAMNLAMEVQQNLLPKKMPQIKGLDIAARSIYCDAGRSNVRQRSSGSDYPRWCASIRRPDSITKIVSPRLLSLP
jgi:hypothetical protein